MESKDSKIDVYSIMSMHEDLRENYKYDKGLIYNNFLNLLNNISFMIKHDTYKVEGRDSIITQWEYVLTLVQCKNKIRFIQAPRYKDKGIAGIWDFYCTQEQLENLLVLSKIDQESVLDSVNIKVRVVGEVIKYNEIENEKLCNIIHK